MEFPYEITVEELKQKLDQGEQIVVLDVREPYEYEISNLGGLLIPLRELPARMQELDPEQHIVAHCKSGMRSAEAVAFLRSAGFSRVQNLSGGILAWADRIDTSLRRY